MDSGILTRIASASVTMTLKETNATNPNACIANPHSLLVRVTECVNYQRMELHDAGAMAAGKETAVKRALLLLPLAIRTF